MQAHTDDERNYTDDDTARVREAEAAAASTAPYTQPQQSYTAPVRRRDDMLALALIAVGVLALLAQFWPGRGELIGGMVLLTIASCFLFFAFWKRIYGLLIPGCILGGLSVGVPLAGVTHGVSVLWGLALGFIAILLVGRVLFHKSCQWPVYPAVSLFAVGIIVAVSILPTIFASVLAWLPLLLIGLGLYLGWARQSTV